MTLMDILERKHISARRNLFHLRDLKGGLFYILVENLLNENPVWESYDDSINGALVLLKNFNKKGIKKRIMNGEMFIPITDIKYDGGQNITGDVLFKLKKVSPFTTEESPILFGNASEYDLRQGVKKGKLKKISFKISDAEYLMRKGSIRY